MLLQTELGKALEVVIDAVFLRSRLLTRLHPYPDVGLMIISGG